MRAFGKREMRAFGKKEMRAFGYLSTGTEIKETEIKERHVLSM